MNQYSDLLSELSDFLYPRSPYYGDLKSEHLEFNAQLQDFSQRVSYISGLQTGGKLSSEEAYKQIHILWKNLKMTKKKILIC
ncbi:hypothetical protein QHH11_00205 [Aphanizomenon sp. PH219]|uniref:Isopropylmalate/homocitrate/citramalate synthase n=1 Tax=Dolichospermum heterosporum TAC447 TaxID=747523 RepID=A0ABY5LTM0_9CYAN|nr:MULTISPECIES: hypothetical protein [Aphanizomenonaceae]MDK2407831.1 hypothetical protein [Aphanizomenon sp. 202]MDK2457575.1 hypothetical protein [Aphanizomenon sp. PH219]UUO15353.1 hypothetical protein NG743_25745 [Dolichospermum heterosporum TAC447]